MSDKDTVPIPPSSPPNPSEPRVQPPQRPPFAPPFLWRLGSTAVIAATGYLSRGFLLACTKRLEVHGLEEFLRLLDERRDVEGRTRGLITVSNHLSIIDDPLVWGVLPFRYMSSPDNLRWSLGSHDLMFKNKATSLFFSLGQCLPTHRVQHSEYGGVFQPTMTQAIRLLSSQPFTHPSPPLSPIKSGFLRTIFPSSPPPTPPIDPPDPFTDPSAPLLNPTYTTTGADTFPAPSYYPSRRHAWIHIFPEGRIHQHPTQTMRYFRWGVSRMILEAEPCPDVVPMWIEGVQDVFHETRTWPRPVPRSGATVRVEFGTPLDVEEVFGGYRRRWRELVEKRRGPGEAWTWDEVGVVEDGRLRYGDEALQLRMEVAKRVRDEVLKLRTARGWVEEEWDAELAERWKISGTGKDGRLLQGGN